MEMVTPGAILRRSPHRVAALLVCLAVLAAGCAPSQPEPSAAADPAAQSSTVGPARYRRTGPQANGAASGPIARIGAALSLTGSARMFGSTQRNGIKLAQDEIN